MNDKSDICEWIECVRLGSSGYITQWVPSCQHIRVVECQGNYCEYCGEIKGVSYLSKIQDLYGAKGMTGWRIGTTYSQRTDDLPIKELAAIEQSRKNPPR